MRPEVETIDGVARLRLVNERSASEIAALKGRMVGESWVEWLVGSARPRAWEGEFLAGPVQVYRPGGELLLSYYPGVIPEGACREAWPVLRSVGGSPSNRGAATGVPNVKGRTLADGSRSGTSMARDHPRIDAIGASGIVGAMERSAHRLPMCRLTAYSLENPDQVRRAMPFVQAADRHFSEQLPERHAAQMSFVQRTNPAWVMPETAFTTMTVNRDFRTAVHQDQGDLREGFGVLAVLRAGAYRGCYTVFPAFGVGVDMGTGGVLLADVHQWHGNTPLVGAAGRYERIACVLYYRDKMERCGSPEEEIQVARARGESGPMWSPSDNPLRRAERHDFQWLKEGVAASREIAGLFPRGFSLAWKKYLENPQPREEWWVIRGEGFVHLNRRLDGIATVYEIAVFPGKRRRGAGRRLLTAAGTRVRLKTDVGNAASNAFYERLGYVRGEETKSRSGRRRLVAWSLGLHDQGVS